MKGQNKPYINFLKNVPRQAGGYLPIGEGINKSLRYKESTQDNGDAVYQLTETF